MEAVLSRYHSFPWAAKIHVVPLFVSVGQKPLMIAYFLKLSPQSLALKLTA